MTPALMQELRRLFGARMALMENERPRVEPASERELIRLLQLLAEHRASFAELTLARDRFNVVGTLDSQSGLIEVGAGVRLQQLEDKVASEGFSLGPLSPSMLKLQVAEFVEGPCAGLHVARGGRLEPMPIALSALLADGSIYRSLASPRSAAGPDLDALFLGGGARAGLVLSATLRLCARSSTARLVVVSAPELSALTRAIRGAVLEGAWVARVRLWQESGRSLAEVRLVGTAESVDRDRETLAKRVSTNGGRLESANSNAPSSAGRSERELSWEALSRFPSTGAWVLHRISVDSVLAEDDAQDSASAVTEPLASPVFAAVDVARLFGGRT